LRGYQRRNPLAVASQPEIKLVAFRTLPALPARRAARIFPLSISLATAEASSLFWHDDTLACGQPSAFTPRGEVVRLGALRHECRSRSARWMRWRCKNSLAKLLLVSSRAARLWGPKVRQPAE